MVQHMNVPALKKQWVLDAQWTDCPPEVEEVVRALWRAYELGNDNYMLRLTVDQFEQFEEEGFETEVWEDTKWIKKPISLKPLIDYIRDAGIPDDEQVIIHWWW